ncbi:MAG: hypothetical protein ACI4MS_05715, partial [Candidatus Coproplasma sp.]
HINVTASPPRGEAERVGRLRLWDCLVTLFLAMTTYHHIGVSPLHRYEQDKEREDNPKEFT